MFAELPAYCSVVIQPTNHVIKFMYIHFDIVVICNRASTRMYHCLPLRLLFSQKSVQAMDEILKFLIILKILSWNTNNSVTATSITVFLHAIHLFLWSFRNWICIS